VSLEQTRVSAISVSRLNGNKPRPRKWSCQHFIYDSWIDCSILLSLHNIIITCYYLISGL